MAPSVDAISPSDFSQDYYSSGLRATYNVDVARLATNKTQPSANITYESNLSSYLARSSTRARSADLEKEVPKGWPQALSGSMDWTGSDFKDESEFVYNLSRDEKDEISRALEHFKGNKESYYPPFRGFHRQNPETDTRRSRNFLRQSRTGQLPYSKPRCATLEDL